jgi:hypothetical protein
MDHNSLLETSQIDVHVAGTALTLQSGIHDTPPAKSGMYARPHITGVSVNSDIKKQAFPLPDTFVCQRTVIKLKQSDDRLCSAVYR